MAKWRKNETLLLHNFRNLQTMEKFMEEMLERKKKTLE